MEDIKDTLLKILELQENIDNRLDDFEERLEKVESKAHEQHVLSDPELTEAIKKFEELMKKYEPVPDFDYTPSPLPYYRPWATRPPSFTDVKIC